VNLLSPRHPEAEAEIRASSALSLFRRIRDLLQRERPRLYQSRSSSRRIGAFRLPTLRPSRVDTGGFGLCVSPVMREHLLP